MVEQTTVNREAAGSIPAPRVEYDCFSEPYTPWWDHRATHERGRMYAWYIKRGWRFYRVSGNLFDGYRVCFTRKKEDPMYIVDGSKWYEIVRFSEVREGDLHIALDDDGTLSIETSERDWPTDDYKSFILEEVF